MIKQIPVSALRVGMYLHQLEGSWTEHPFWRNKFTLEAADIERIRDTGIATAWIDSARGRGEDELAADRAAAPVAPPSAADTRGRWVSHEEKLAVADIAMEVGEPEPPASAKLDLERARALCEQARTLMEGLFGEARGSHAVDATRCAPLVEEIVAQVMNDPSALLLLARLKKHDEYNHLHAVAVATLMAALGKQLNLADAQVRELALGGLLHDVGNLFVPEEILAKRGPLTTQEYLQVKAHVLRGHGLLQQGHTASALVLDVCLHHHERIDGSGYPHGLRGGQLSVYAKMAAVCDVYDALTSERPHRAKLDPSRALRQMAATQNLFDPLLFQAFVKTVGIYPVGVAVKLQSDQLAVVLSQDERSLLKPRVKVFYSLARQRPMRGGVVQLADAGCADKIVEVSERPDLQEMALAEL